MLAGEHLTGAVAGSISDGVLIVQNGSRRGRAHVSAMLGGLRELVSGIELRGEPQRLFSNFVYGYQSVPLTLHG